MKVNLTKFLNISTEKKFKLFKITNKIVFCKVMNFHLPVLRGGRFLCVICDKGF